jgi:hypothetical protein
MSQQEDLNRLANLAAKAYTDPHFASELLNQQTRERVLRDRRKKGECQWGLHIRIVNGLLGLRSFTTPEEFLEAATEVVRQVGKLE